jgi:hypothetical protein
LSIEIVSPAPLSQRIVSRREVIQSWPAWKALPPPRQKFVVYVAPYPVSLVTLQVLLRTRFANSIERATTLSSVWGVSPTQSLVAVQTPPATLHQVMARDRKAPASSQGLTTQFPGWGEPQYWRPPSSRQVWASALPGANEMAPTDDAKH